MKSMATWRNPRPAHAARAKTPDLYAPQVGDFLGQRDALRQAVPGVAPPPLIVRILYSSCFYLSIAGGLGALCAWGILEPHLDDAVFQRRQEIPLVFFLVFPTVAGSVGLFLGAVEGIMCRNLQRAFVCSVVGLGVGFGAGLV